MRDEVDLNALTSDLLTVVKETMQPAHLSLWLKPTVNSGSTVAVDRAPLSAVEPSLRSTP